MAASQKKAAPASSKKASKVDALAVTPAAAPAPAVATSATSATLQVFWDLAKEDAQERAAACARLVAGVQAEQAAFVAAGGAVKKVKSEDSDEDMDEDDDEEGAGAKLAPTVLSSDLVPSLSYALKRLTRGLASSRAGARQGFALALTEILAHMPVVRTEDVLAIVADQVKLSSKANKQETRDYHLGRVFFALVLARSGRVASLSADALASFVTEIIEFAKGHLPIREVSYETVTHLMRALGWKQFADSKLQRYLLKEIANQSLENLSIEQIGLSIALKEYYEANGQELPYSSNTDADADDKTTLIVSSSVRKLFSSKYLVQLHAAMFSSMQHYAITDKLHSTWSTMLMHLWRYYPIDKFAAFWKANVEEALFGGSVNLVVAAANPNQVKSTSFSKKFIGFQLVNQVLAILPNAFSHADKAAVGSLLAATSIDQVVSLVFRSKNFLRTLVNNMGSAKHVLNPSTILVRRAILAFAANQPNSILTIISHLEDSSAGGHQRFDSRTNSNLVLKLLEGLDAAGVASYVDKLIVNFQNAVPVAPISDEDKAAGVVAPIAQPTPKKGKKDATPAAPVSTAAAIDSVDSAELAQQALDSTRQFSVEQVFLLARNKALPSGDWLKRALSFLFYFGFFEPSAAKTAPFSQPKHAVSEKTRTFMADKLFHLLNELLPHAPVSKRPAVEVKDTKKGKGKKGGKKDANAEDSDEEMAEEDEEKAAEVSASSLAAFHGLFSASATTLPWALQLHREWSAWTAGKKASVVLLEPLSKEETATRDATLAYVDTLREKYEAKLGDSAPSEEDKTVLAQLRSLQLLLLHLSLLLLRPEDREFATPLMEELQEGAATLFIEEKKGKKGAKKATADADKPQFINVLVDILLSLIIRPSTLFRDIAKSTFLAFVGSVNEEALDELLLVLRRKDKSGGEDDEDEDEDDFHSDEDEEDEEEESDDEDDKKKSQHNKSKKNAPKKPQMSALDAQAAANKAKYAKFAADSDASDDDDQMIDLDGLNGAFAESDSDEDAPELGAGQLDTYDAHLGNIVRLRKERKLVHKETAQQSLHFKLRVCDLLEVFVRSQAAGPLGLRMHIPMLLAIDAARGNKDAKQLQQRLVTLFKKLCSAKDHPAVTAERAVEIRALMTVLMSRAVKTISRETLHLTNLALLSLAKILMPRDAKEQVEGTVAALAAAGKKGKAGAAADSPIAFVLGLYRKSLVDSLSIRHHDELNTKFFTDFFAKFPSLSWSFVGDLAALARAKLPAELQAKATPATASELYAATAFKRNECFTLLLSVFNNRRVLKEHGESAKFLPSLPNLIEAVRSSLVVSTVPKSSLVQEEDSDDEDEEASAKDPRQIEKAALLAAKREGMDKKERERFDAKEKRRAKARAKKSRRIAKHKAAAKAAAESAEGALDAAALKAKAEHDTHKSSLNRLKVVLKFANQAALAFDGDKLLSGLTTALTGLPATLATPLKAAIGTFLISAKIDASAVKLKFDAKLLNKPNPNQIKKPVPTKKGGKAAAAAAPSAKKPESKKRPADATAEKSVEKKAKIAAPVAAAAPVAVVKKSNNRNKIPSSVPSLAEATATAAPTTPAKEKKRPAEATEEKSSKKLKQ